MMEAITLVKQVLENRRKIETLRRENDKDDIHLEQETRRIRWDVYEPKIRALQKERDAALSAMQTSRDVVVAERDKQIENLSQVITQVQRILEFLRVQSEDLTIDDNDIRVYDGQYKENLGHIYKDKYMEIKLFIAENGKPKNKYSLVAFGKCPFNEKLLERPYSYGLPTGRSRR